MTSLRPDPLTPSAFLDALLGAPAPAAQLDEAGRILQVNEAWVARFGGAREHYVGRAPESVVAAGVPLSFAPLPASLGGAELVYAPAAGSDGGDIPARVFDELPIGMGVFDAAFRFLRVNAALCALFELPAEELLGRPYHDFVHPDERTPAASRMQAARSGALSAGTMERRYVTGKGRVVLVRASGVRLTATPPTFFGVFADVTDRREPDGEAARLQEQAIHAERLRTLGQLAAGMAHEINNPASIAIGGVDLARRRIAAATAAAKTGDLAGVRRQLDQLELALRYCEDGALRVTQAASRFGGFATLRSGRLERVDPNELVRRAVGLVRNEIRHRAQLEVTLGEVPRIVAYGDRIVQVVTGLLVNAGQAVDGPADEHTIAVTTAAAPGAVTITVRDTGPTVAKDVLERLFEPFGPTRGKDRSGGFGLSVARQIVQQHGGDIGVESAPGGGLAFVVHLPVVNGLVADEDQPVRGARILVVDDEPYLLEVFAQLLGEDHEVVVADGGRRALELLGREARFDLVICDLMMPEVDGVAVHEWLREHRPDLAERTLFCTGGAFTERAERYLAAGNRPVLAKPFSSDEVIRSVGALLRTASKTTG